MRASGCRTAIDHAEQRVRRRRPLRRDAGSAGHARVSHETDAEHGYGLAGIDGLVPVRGIVLTDIDMTTTGPNISASYAGL